MRNWKSPKLIAITVAALIVVVGLAMAATRAGSTFASLEAEGGTVAAPANMINDDTASGGKALVFGPTVVTAPQAVGTLRGEKLYVFKPVAWQSRPAEVYDYQVGKWYGNWITNIRAEVDAQVTAATSRGELALLVAYNIPGRDCGSYSAGGAGNSANYRQWIREFAAGIGNRKAIVVLEPDALAQYDCLNATDQNMRVSDIADAVSVFKSQTKAYVYIDGGNTTWKDVPTMVDRLKRANVVNAQGFSLNVSNFKYTQDTANYGDAIAKGLASAGVSGKRYVIDTSRNGKGPAANNEWCNPPGRGLGKRPSTSPDIGAYNDAYLWIKTTGESDGPCNDGPAAGQYFPAYIQSLIQNAVY